MVRPRLSPQERVRGEKLGAILREARGKRSMVEVAAASGVPIETLRKIEAGRVPTPAFFTVVTLAFALDLSIEQIISQCTVTDRDTVDMLLAS
jgi:transcriptional regulator with XRE-family HTH domain